MRKNKKGFTTVELVLTIVLVIIIMGTITNVTYTYRDRSIYEETLTEVINYKNTLTKIIYDDILNSSDPVVKITKVDDNYKLITLNNKEFALNLINETNKVGISYNGIDYIIPGSVDELVSIEGIDYVEDNDNGLYRLDIMFSHRNLEDTYKIHLVIS